MFSKFNNCVQRVDCKEINDEIEFCNTNNSDNDSLTSNNDNDGDDDGTINKENIITNKNKLPPKALLNGLYCGPIPEELKGLNFIEISMISINNPITKIRVEG